MSKIVRLREFLNEQGLDYLLINSTNEFLAEYAPLEQNARYVLTGFSGSAGDALLSRHELLLFVDGRYHIQADNEVDAGVVTVMKLQTGQSAFDEVLRKIEPGAVLGVVSTKNTQERVELLREKGVNVKLLDTDPVLPARRQELPEQNITQLDVSLTGLTSEEKIAKLNLDGQFFLSVPEEVSYILNERDFSHKYSCAVHRKIKIGQGETVYADKATISAYDYGLFGEKARPAESPVKFMKAVKTDAEIGHYKDAFARTDASVRAIREYVLNTEGISERDIALRLEREFLERGAKSLSFEPIVAKGRNSALAHYSKKSPDEIVEDGDIVLVDCGAYYEGGLATDITRVFVKGEPSPLQKQVYTTVLKAFLGAFNYPAAGPVTGFELDACAREIFARNTVEGFVFNHGLGHGLGISVHEYPPSLSCAECAKVEITDNMCFTIEPGLYNEAHFGVRLENACYFKAGKIRSFTNMNFEQKLIDYGMLNSEEREWLKKFLA